MAIQFRPHYRWPSGLSQTLFCCRIDLEDFAKQHGLQYIRHKDGLGWYSATDFSLPGIECVAIIEYDNAREEFGAEVMVDKLVDKSKAFDQIVSEMNLSSSDLMWTNQE